MIIKKYKYQININYISYSIQMQIIKSLNILILFNKLNVYHNCFNF